uniref:PWI domain-containing protein n=1 Tax=Acrobeloides nanus TaxID=290746 RepID=A0A914BYJ1_9BILA
MDFSAFRARAPGAVAFSSAAPRVGLLPTPNATRPATYQFFTNPTPTPIARPTITIVRPATVLAASPNSPQCGSVENWKRIQGSNGKFQAFGFCEFEHPEGTMRALRVLNDYPLGDKKLVVKVEDKTRKMIRDFMAARRAENGQPPEILAEDQLPCDEASLKEDGTTKERIMKIIKDQQPDLLKYEVEDVEVKNEKKESSSSSSDSEGDSKRKRSVSRTSSRKRTSRRKHSRSVSSDRGSKRRRSGSETEDSETAEEKRRLRRVAKNKQAEYEARVKKWEEREKRMAKQYALDEEKELQRKRAIMREAKKLKAFLEDYDDERDDPKYYKSFRSSALFQRRRDYEREREADAKDRQEEQREIEELKRQILETGEKIEDPDAEARKRHEAHEKEMLRKRREDSGSPNPHIPLGQKRSANAEAESSDDEKKEDDDSTSSDEESAKGKSKEKAAGSWATVEQPPEFSAQGSPSLKQNGAPAIKLPSLMKTSNLNGIFGEEEEEVDTLHVIKPKLVPFEITGEERAQVMTPEERKKMIKDLIDRIPTGKEELFNYKVQWDFVDSKLVENRIQPWVNKKIRDYLGEDEPALANFIGEKIIAHVEPHKLLADLSLVLDDEAEVFIVKMWRLIIYESEAKKLGISSTSTLSTTHHQQSSSSSRSRERSSHKRDRERRH